MGSWQTWAGNGGLLQACCAGEARGGGLQSCGARDCLEALALYKWSRGRRVVATQPEVGALGNTWVGHESQLRTTVQGWGWHLGAAPSLLCLRTPRLCELAGAVLMGWVPCCGSLRGRAGGQSAHSRPLSGELFPSKKKLGATGRVQGPAQPTPPPGHPHQARTLLQDTSRCLLLCALGEDRLVPARAQHPHRDFQEQC